MPAEVNTLVRKYFIWKKDEGVYVCKIHGEDITDNPELWCGTQIKGNKVSNLRTHVKSKHRSVHEKICEKEKPSPAVLKQKPISTYFNTFTVTNMCRINVIKGLLYLVTVNGRPFQSVEDEGLKIAFGPVLERLNRKYNRHNITDLIQSAAKYIIEKLKKILRKSLVSIKSDAVSRFSRSFMGVTVQVIIDGKIQVFTLGLEEILLQHTGKNLKQILLKCLEKYGIYPKNIYTLTSDNGSNFLKMTELLDTEYKQLKYGDIPEISVDDEFQINQFIEVLCDEDWADDNIQAINCIVHTLQLAILDSLKNSWNDEQAAETYMIHIRAARELAKKLRSQKNLVLLSLKGKNRPSLDVETRWGSTYNMIKDILDVKEICNDAVAHGNVDLYLDPETWCALEEIRLTLEPSYIATVKLQSNNVTLTDARKIIHLCWMKTAEIGTTLSQELVYNFEKRRTELMNNSAMLMAMFVDPRYLFELEAEERSSIRKKLIALFKRLQKIESEKVDGQCHEDEGRMDVDSNVDCPGIPHDDDDNEDDVMYERRLKEKDEILRVIRSDDPIPNVLKFEQELNIFEEKYGQCRVDSRISILSFWESIKSTFPFLFNVASIVLAAPGTQVSVERLFSQLKLILSDLRERLGSENAENVLLVRSNFEHLDDEFFIKAALT